MTLARFAAAGTGLAGDGDEPGLGDEVHCGGEPDHVRARFGDDGYGDL